MPKVTTRPAVASDTEFAHTVHHAAYRDVVTRQFGSWDEALQDKWFAEEWRDQDFEIISTDDLPCGYVSLQEEPTRLFLNELVIHPDFQGRGIGTTILNQVFERARARQVPVRLLTFHANRAADLYCRLGFVEIRQTDTQFEMEWNP